MHKIERIDPNNNNLKELTDIRLKLLFDSWKKSYYDRHCSCCDSHGCVHDKSEEIATEMKIISFNIDLIQEALSVRGNIPNSKERKEIRKEEAKNSKKRKGR